MSEDSTSYGTARRGVCSRDVDHAADTLLRAGERPTTDKVRTKIGRGSPNTIGPLLDTWWSRLASRLDSGPAAFHRLPESVAHVAEALWMQALEEGKRRVLIEQRDSARVATLDKDRLELRSHVLSLREGELDSRLHEREKTITELNQRLSELTLLLRKEQATRESLVAQLARRTNAAFATGIVATGSKSLRPAGRRIQSARVSKPKPRGQPSPSARKRKPKLIKGPRTKRPKKRKRR